MPDRSPAPLKASCRASVGEQSIIRTRRPAAAANRTIRPVAAASAAGAAAILCPYDVAGLDRTALDDAGRTHPTLLDGQGRRDSPTYTDPLATAASFNRPLPPMPGHALGMTFDGEFALVEVRRFVVRYASAAGLPAERVGDLTVAVNELATNTIEHASGQGALVLHCKLAHV